MGFRWWANLLGLCSGPPGKKAGHQGSEGPQVPTWPQPRLASCRAPGDGLEISSQAGSSVPQASMPGDLSSTSQVPQGVSLCSFRGAAACDVATRTLSAGCLGCQRQDEVMKACAGIACRTWPVLSSRACGSGRWSTPLWSSGCCLGKDVRLLANSSVVVSSRCLFYCFTVSCVKSL